MKRKSHREPAEQAKALAKYFEGIINNDPVQAVQLASDLLVRGILQYPTKGLQVKHWGIVKRTIEMRCFDLKGRIRRRRLALAAVVIVEFVALVVLV